MSHRSEARRLISALYRMDGAYLEIGKATGVSGSLLVLLYALDDGQPHSQKSISQDWMIPRTTLNTIVKKCEAEGYLSMEKVPKTRREMNLALTPKGKAYAAQVLAPVYRMEDQALAETLKTVSSEFLTGFELFAKNIEKAAQDQLAQD